MPALLGLFNAFLIMGIIVGILYLYWKLVIEKAKTLTAGTAGERLEEEPRKEESKVVKESGGISIASHEEIAAAVAAVRHHIRLTTLAKPTVVVTGSQAFVSAWLSSWLSEVTQSWDYNPYIVEKRRLPGG